MRELIIRNGDVQIHNPGTHSTLHFSPEEALEILELLQKGKKDIKKAAKDQLEQPVTMLPVWAYRFIPVAGEDYFYHATSECTPHALLRDGRRYEELNQKNIHPYVEKKCVHCGEYLD